MLSSGVSLAISILVCYLLILLLNDAVSSFRDFSNYCAYCAFSYRACLMSWKVCYEFLRGLLLVQNL